MSRSTKDAPRKRKYRKPGKISDDEILDLLVDGTIEVNIETADVSVRGRPIKPTIVGRDGDNGTRYRIEIWLDGRRRSIVRAKLVYMAGNLRVIPAGFEVHHIDEDRYGDGFANLVLLSEEDHRKIHGKFCYATRAKAIAEDTPF